MHVSRIAVGDLRLVYVICANRLIKYATGKSPIAYIGTTEKGVDRIAQSAAYRSYDILWRHGISAFDVRIVTCPPRRGIKTWRLLERAMLLAFRDKYGEIPICNKVGTGFSEHNEFRVFARRRITQILYDLENSGLASGSGIET